MEIPPLGRLGRLNCLKLNDYSESVLYSDLVFGWPAYPRLIEYVALIVQSEEQSETGISRLAG